MRSFRKELWFETSGRRVFLNITPQVEAALKESHLREGIALINGMHITASVFINDDEQGLHADYEAWLERLAPHERRREFITGTPKGCHGVVRESTKTCPIGSVTCYRGTWGNVSL
jgi:thiamine phosphate synthase YjbQ (UPF0047 family)